MSGPVDDSGRVRRTAAVTASAGVALRSFLGSSWLLVHRRSWRDRSLLMAWVGLLCLATLLAVAIPRLVIDTVDQGAREAVVGAGSRADVAIHATIGRLTLSPNLSTPRQVQSVADGLPASLPKGLAAVTSSSILTVLSPEILVSVADPSATTSTTAPKPGATNLRTPALSSQLGMLTPELTKQVVVVKGRMPSTSNAKKGADIEVVLSEKAATAASLEVGSVIDASQPTTSESPDLSHRFKIVGIVAQKTQKTQNTQETHGAKAGPPPWQDMPQLWKPEKHEQPGSSRQLTAITLLTTPDGIAASSHLFADQVDANIRVRLSPASFTAELEARVSDELDALAASPARIVAYSGAKVSVRSEFSAALADFPLEARAAIAQMSLLLAGLLGVAATVILLVSRLIIVRRTGELALERARGASLTSVAVRAALESVVTALVGAALGLGAAMLLLPGALWQPESLVAVVVIAAIAPVWQSVALARSEWRGQREPANRQERLDKARRGKARRLVVEATLLLLAAAALYSVRSRGLFETRTDGVDPLLVATPLLLAIAITLVLLRVYPSIVRGASHLGRRTRGVLGIPAASAARPALAALPLLALTLAVAVAVGGGLLTDTVRAGQIDASWQRIGADVRVDAKVTPDKVAKVAARPGVTAAGSALVKRGIDLTGGPAFAVATLLAVDSGYADVVSQVPVSEGDPPKRGVAGLRKLAATSASDPLPVVVDSELADQLVTKDFTINFEGQNIRLRVIGEVNTGPSGYLGGPFLYVDLPSLAERADKPLTASSLLIVGTGARQAAATLHVPSRHILSRATWITHRQHLALVAGVSSTMLVSAAAALLLAALALIATVLAGARRRARSLSLLRTLGMKPGLAWWLALAELAPVVIAPVAGGVVAGIGIVLAIGPALGLDVLAGGIADPALRISPAVILGVIVGAVAILGVAMLCEVVAHRRDRLTEILRVGETG